MKIAIRLVVIFLVAHALYRFVPIYLHYQQFKDAVNETALFAKDKPDVDVVNRVMELATEHEIPLAREYVRVRRQFGQTHIDATWVQKIKWLPGYERAWQFEVGHPEVVDGAAPSR